eukprot:PhF_6_TR9234/c1_g3_i1/m.14572
MKHMLIACLLLLRCIHHAESTASTHEELCGALNNATVTQVVVTSLIRFDAACTVQLLHRGTVQLSCMKSDDYAHFHCPKSLFCLNIMNTPAAESFNSTLSIHGCSIVGGGFLSVEDSPINITIDACRYTTQNLSTTVGFLHYQLSIQATQPSTVRDGVLVQIMNTALDNVYMLTRSCVLVFAD